MIKELRSLIHEKFPLDLRIQFELLSKRRDIINQEKQEEIIKLLQSSNITGIVPLGPGTNRYAFKLDGFVIKVATDRDGKIDNLKEFKMAKHLFPYVTKTYEVSSNGTLLVAEYIQPFMSYGEMLTYADKIREILAKISSIYLIGDVGISNNNFTNWGLRVGTDDPVCLDFAYVYDVNSDLFICNKCNSGSILIPNSDFTTLICTNKACKRETQFSEIRGRIGNEMHRQEIGDLTEEGYLMYGSHIETELDIERSSYLKKDKSKDDKNKQKKNEQHATKDNDDNEPASNNNDNILNVQREEMYMENLEEKAMCVESSNIRVEVLAVTPSTKKEVTPDVQTVTATESNLESAIAPEVVNVVLSDTNHELEYDYSKLNKAISDISNMIEVKLEEDKLYQLVTSKFKNHRWKYREGEFYKDTQNAVYRSLAAFCGLEKYEKDGRKLFKQAIQVEGSEFESTVQYILKLWNTIVDLSLDDISDAVKYLKDNNPEMGIDKEWVNKLKKRIMKKMSVSKDISVLIADSVSKLLTLNDIEEDTIHIAHEEVEPELELNIDNIDDLSEEILTDDEKALFNIENEIEYVEPETTVPDIEEKVEEDKSTKIIIGSSNSGIRYIKSIQYASEEVGHVSIPLFIQIDDSEDEFVPEKTTTSEINGRWEWLKHTCPDVVFTSTKPKFWTALNDDKSKGDIGNYKSVAIRKQKDNGWLIGLFNIVDERFIQDENQNSLTNEKDLLEKVNCAICEEIGGTYVSYMNSFNDVKSIEENIIISHYLLTPCDNLDEEELIQNCSDKSVDDLEDLAAQLLMGDDIPVSDEQSIENDDLEIEIERPINESEEIAQIVEEEKEDIEAAVQQSEEDINEVENCLNNTDWFTPVRRKL